MGHRKTRRLCGLAGLLLAACLTAAGQPVFSCTAGTASFFSSAPLENIEASSGSLNSMLNAATGEMVFIVPMRSFHFKKALMEDHFNERYVESGKFPQAVYKGRLNGPVDPGTAGERLVTATGTLTLHGVERSRTDTATLTVADGTITLEGRFPLAVADHGIRIPTLVNRNIADTVMVSFKATYVPYRKADE